ncbi:MAG: hypothetical protein MJH11_20485 [Lentisphaeria bacterium]|nr:hypothetical protein [Lentisphaeria bacterium]
MKKKFLLSVCFLFLGAYFPIFAEDLFPDVEPVEKEMPGKKPKADDDKKPGEKTEESTEEEEYNATLNIDVMLTSKVRNSITMAVHNLRITALNDEANLFFPPTRHKKIVDYTTREYVRRSCSICASGGKHETRESKVAIYKYEYEYYDTLKRVKGHSMTTSSVKRVRSRRVTKRTKTGERTVHHPIHNNKKETTHTQKLPIYGPGGTESVYNGFYAQNAMSIFALLKAGVKPTDEDFRKSINTVTDYVNAYGIPDNTYDLAWLIIAYVNLPKTVTLKRECQGMINKLLLGQIDSGPAKGLWGSVCVNNLLISRMMEHELEVHDNEVLKWQEQLKKHPKKKRYKKKIEAGKARLTQFVKYYDTLSSKCLEYERIQHWQSMEPRPDALLHLQLKRASIEGLPVYIFKEQTADIESTGLVLMALREAEKNGYLPERPRVPNFMTRKKPIIKVLSTKEIIALASQKISNMQRKKGGWTEGNYWTPIHLYDSSLLPQLPVDDETYFTKVDSLSSYLSSSYGYRAYSHAVSSGRHSQKLLKAEAYILSYLSKLENAENNL